MRTTQTRSGVPPIAARPHCNPAMDRAAQATSAFLVAHVGNSPMCADIENEICASALSRPNVCFKAAMDGANSHPTLRLPLSLSIQPSAFGILRRGSLPTPPWPDAKNPNRARNPPTAPIRGHTQKIPSTFSDWCNWRLALRFPVITFSRFHLPTARWISHSIPPIVPARPSR